MLRILLIALISLVLPATVATAQDSPRAILVLDGSGSMWGQIDGVNKIVIAREVIGELLGTLPADQELGLMSYGHRRKGDCSDIELLIEPGTDRTAIAAAVNAINPKGKTPLSDAVIKAAEALRFSEEVATVILISDGIETCERDPCAVGRMLEETGVNFTAHVIGFDVADPEALAQLQCLAEETGGQFRTAANAAELAEALSVVAEPEPAPLPVEVTFRATDGENGPVIEAGLIWTISTDAAGAVVDNGDEPSPSLELLPGSGRAEVLRLSDEAAGDAMFTVTGDETGGKVVTIALPAFVPDATLDAPATAPAGSLVPVRWTGPDGQGDYISSSNLDMHDGEHYDYAYTADTKDGVVMVRMPPEDGIYELRYILNDGTKVLVRREIKVTPLDITLTPPDGAVIGTSARAGWTGPDYEGDYLAVSRPDADDGQYETYAYTRDGDPLSLDMPSEAGTYELRYVLGASGYVAARALFDVVETETFVTAPETAPEGSTIKVTWAGPDGQNDYISIAPMGADDAKYDAYTYTRDGSPLKLTLPMGPGAYEIRYVLGQDRTVLARTPITLTQVTASLEAADTAAAGSELKVTWEGPDYATDYVSIAPLDSEDGKYLGYAYTGNGNPARFQAPIEPGDYELRYVANASPDVVLARRPITISDVTASLEAAESAPAGSVLKITWEGPDNDRDYISIAKPDADDNRYSGYVYAASGNPAKLEMPTEPGDYELRYVANASPDKVLARVPIRVEAVGATLQAPASADAGSILKVEWTGPNGDRDYISVAEPDQNPDRYLTYSYIRDGSPTRVNLPTEPGNYELRYVQNGDPVKVIARTTLEVTAVGATLQAPASADAGSILKVDWTGPNGDRDYISVAEPDQNPDRYLTYSYIRDGSPARVNLPTEPGNYELRYVQNGDPVKVIARTTLEVTAVGATLQAPASADAGSILKVDWTGPGGDRDYISVAEPDQAPSRYLTYSYLRDGSPARVNLPTEPGSYELRYVQNGDPVKVIVSVPLEVIAVAATLDATPDAPAGSTLKVTWEGPGGDRDFVSIAEPDQAPSRYLTYGYIRDGNPVDVQVPTAPGSYELRYILNGTPERIIGTETLEVTPVTATLDAPASVAPGGAIRVEWTGPGYRRDYLAIALPDERPDRYADYAYARDGTPAELKAPETPGTYELRYVVTGDTNAIVARRTLVVE